MKTAEEVLVDNGVLKELGIKTNFNLQLTRDCYTGTQRDIKKAMIEFAKMHVQAALDSAGSKATLCVNQEQYGNTYPHVYESYEESQRGMPGFMTSISVSESSILEAYPLENIV